MSVSTRVRAADQAFARVKDFYFSSRYGQARLGPDVCDFTFGNPHEMPLPGLVSALRERALPHDKNWFAYKTSEEEPRAFVAEQLSRELGLPFEPEDLAAISVALRLVLDAGQEVVFPEPGWFCYEPTVLAADLVPRPVRLVEPTFDLDLDAIDRAIGPKTRLVIVNTPHNPTGRVYPREALEALAQLLERASARVGHRVYLLSDEPYRRLRFDGRGFTSPAAVYPWTMISYSWGKVLLAPGQRLGYLAISPLMPAAERHELRDAVFGAQMALGWCFPNALMQYAIPDVEHISIDRDALARRRDLLMGTLVASGYQPVPPEGTFYIWSRWPEGADPEAAWNALADRNVFVMPGSVMNSPEWFRISLTASDGMVSAALPHFARVGREQGAVATGAGRPI
jgi:aspartate aminotransferase